MAYFDTSTVSGFTVRVHYEERLGVVTITNIQLQSTLYGGGSTGKWWPGGTIKVNGETVLTMDFNSPATHYFPISANGDTFADIVVSSGVALPVSSVQIFAESAEITVNVTLWRSSDRIAIYDITGAETVNLTVGLVYIDTGDALEPHLAYIDNGTGWDLCVPYSDNGTEWELCT